MNRLLVAVLALIGLLTLALIVYVAYWVIYFYALFEVLTFPFQS